MRALREAASKGTQSDGRQTSINFEENIKVHIEVHFFGTDAKNTRFFNAAYGLNAPNGAASEPSFFDVQAIDVSFLRGKYMGTFSVAIIENR